MSIIKKLSLPFKKQEDLKIFLVNVTPRAVYEHSNKGGIRITLKFVKTTKRFWITKTLTDTVTFDNYHRHDGKFAYNPPYIPFEDAHSEDELWHALVKQDCEDYPWMKVTTKWLNEIIDKWYEENKNKLNFTLK